MKLRWQIGIIALLSLSFPLLAWYAFVQLNQSYQHNMLQAAEKQAAIINQSIKQFAGTKPTLDGLIAEPLKQAPQLDGNSDEWQSLTWYPINSAIRFKLATWQSQLLLLIEVQDSSPEIDINRQRDRLIIAVADGNGIKKYTIGRQAEGQVFTEPNADFSAFWHETANGYLLEFKLNKQSTTAIGLAAIDHNQQQINHYGHLQNQQIQLQPLFQTDPQWQNFLDQIKPKDGQIMLQDPQSRILYQTTANQTQTPIADPFSEWLYQLIFAPADQQPNDFYGQTINHPTDFGSITIEIKQTQAQITLIQTFLKTTAWLIIAALLLISGYLLYAALLAWRIKKLNRSLQHALDEQGSIHTTLPAANDNDEIGDLSKGMSRLLSRINDYTDYLKQLGGRLSHEMKTPISIVQSSLENIIMQQPDNPFAQRAINANHRLKFILNQLSALSRLKQAIEQSEKQPTNLSHLIAELGQAYAQQCPRIKTKIHNPDIQLNAAPELIAQMLDKLIHNAQTHSQEHDQILIELQQTTAQITLTVFNSGSELDPKHQHKIFDSLASFRTQKSTQPHLGLGLHIAKLIAEYHQANITAQNQPTPQSGVTFTITFNK